MNALQFDEKNTIFSGYTLVQLSHLFSPVVAMIMTMVPVRLRSHSIVVTTNILGDVVSNMVGDSFDVETIMPPGSDPHDFQASAQQVENDDVSTDLLIVNGANFEEGMLDVIENAEADGVMVFEAISVVSQ